jgi:hypothetical protein
MNTYKNKNQYKGGNCSGSGWAWQLNNLGTSNQQFDRVMNSNLGNTATQSSNTINTIANPNINNNWKGGRRRRHRTLRRRRHGGNFGSVVGQALAPGILLAAQNIYRPKSRRRSFKRKSIKRRKTRKSRY